MNHVAGEGAGVSRRKLLKRGAAAGALVWAAPVMSSVAFASEPGSAPPSTGDDTAPCGIRWLAWSDEPPLGEPRDVLYCSQGRPVLRFRFVLDGTQDGGCLRGMYWRYTVTHCDGAVSDGGASLIDRSIGSVEVNHGLPTATQGRTCDFRVTLEVATTVQGSPTYARTIGPRQLTVPTC